MNSLKKNARWYFLSIFFLINVLIWYTVFAETRNGILTVAFLDVGQGDAIFVETPVGNQILIDGGPNKAILQELSRVMPFYDRSIDVLILSHPHLDHLGGLVEVLKRYNIGFVLVAGDNAASAEFAEWQKLIRKKNVVEFPARRGIRLSAGDDVYFDILLPDKLLEGGPHQNMVVGRLSYGNICFIFTGDMERDLEFKILKDDIDCEVLKVGHHGSKTSTSEAFLKAVSPEIAVIQVGAKNRYKHPNEAILERLSPSVSQIFRTDTDGTVVLQSDGNNIKIKK